MNYENIVNDYTLLHAMTNYGDCPNDRLRAEVVATWLGERLQPEAEVLDCSAGRGQFMELMYRRSMKCTATEADPYLCINRLSKWESFQLRYDQLGTLRPRQWDAVVSIEVLEHLPTETDARAALKALAALSRKWLCISVGLMPSQWRLPSFELVTLHYVVQTAEWWEAEVGKVARVLEARDAHGSHMMFCEVLPCPTC